MPHASFFLFFLLEAAETKVRGIFGKILRQYETCIEGAGALRECVKGEGPLNSLSKGSLKINEWLLGG